MKIVASLSAFSVKQQWILWWIIVHKVASFCSRRCVMYDSKHLVISTIAPIHSHTASHVSSDVSMSCQIFHDVITLVCRYSRPDRTTFFLKKFFVVLLSEQKKNSFTWFHDPLKSVLKVLLSYPISYIRLSNFWCPLQPTLMSVKVKFYTGPVGSRS